MKVTKRILIRGSYRKLASLLRGTNSDPANVLIGTPAVDKSHFAFYFVYTLIRLGIPVVFDKVNYYLFNSDCFLVCDNLKAIRHELGDNLC